MDPEDANTPTTQLLTLLNVSALKSRKRMRDTEESESGPHEKLNKRKPNKFNAEPECEAGPSELPTRGPKEPRTTRTIQQVKPFPNATDPYEQHFGPKPHTLTDSNMISVDQKNWTSKREKIGKLTAVASLLPEDHAPLPKKLAKKTAVQSDLLSILSAHLDLYHPAITLEHHQCIREAIALHTVDHITKIRRRVHKNTQRISHAKSTSSEPPEDVQDQGFTRPSVLVLLPFRSSALAWLNALTVHTPSFQIENHARFLREYGLPLDAVDKLATAPPGSYPADHVEMFKGNVDDSFRVGVKMTKKSVKLFADFYSCDLILASPLGLRMSIEKEKSADFLSSVEILVVDQTNALAMQNWDHVQFVLSYLNKLPKESHDADFSRIKPWYLDGHSAYLRQSILISPFEMPETRSIYNTSLKNVAGKVRVEKTWSALQIPEGIDQTFLTFDCSNPKDEADKRFSYFTTQLLPKILKSAVQSANTIVFIPSSFDFIRVPFTVLSEYSSNQDISRARQEFFSGKNERFHFYRRYKIRGIRNILFYGPPMHPQFFSEFLGYPFLDDGVDPSDVTCRIVGCQYDWFKLERILGSKGVKEVFGEVR
ncbi:digestive organ expansion factor [Melanogaster broomeanus]|nr:digestive organ expansion factor [Melanogaster broomeanus]